MGIASKGANKIRNLVLVVGKYIALILILKDAQKQSVKHI